MYSELVVISLLVAIRSTPPSVVCAARVKPRPPPPDKWKTLRYTYTLYFSYLAIGCSRLTNVRVKNSALTLSNATLKKVHSRVNPRKIPIKYPRVLFIKQA